MMLKGKIKDESTRTAWAEYKDGFQLEIRYLPRAKTQRINEACTERTWDAKLATFIDKVNREKLQQALATEIIRNWRTMVRGEDDRVSIVDGLTGDVLRKLVDMDEYPDLVPYSAEDCAELLAKDYGLELWVQNVATNMEFFEATRRAAETKNSLRSPAGN